MSSFLLNDSETSSFGSDYLIPLLKKITVAVFVMAHMSAVGIYSSPGNTGVPALKQMREALIGHVRPYMLMTSQWQQWNLFSPDPLRRVARYRIEQSKDDTWVTIKLIAPETLGFWEQAPKLKAMRHIEDPGKNQSARNRLLELACRDHALPAATALRLQWEYYVIPKHRIPVSLEWWHSWKPEWHRSVTAELTCPANA